MKGVKESVPLEHPVYMATLNQMPHLRASVSWGVLDLAVINVNKSFVGLRLNQDFGIMIPVSDYSVT